MFLEISHYSKAHQIQVSPLVRASQLTFQTESSQKGKLVSANTEVWCICRCANSISAVNRLWETPWNWKWYWHRFFLRSHWLDCRAKWLIHLFSEYIWLTRHKIFHNILTSSVTFSVTLGKPPIINFLKYLEFFTIQVDTPLPHQRQLRDTDPPDIEHGTLSNRTMSIQDIEHQEFEHSWTGKSCTKNVHTILSTFILFNQPPSSFIHFHPLSSIFILFYPQSSSYIHFHPLGWHWTGNWLALDWHWAGTGLAPGWHFACTGLSLGWHLTCTWLARG